VKRRARAIVGAAALVGGFWLVAAGGCDSSGTQTERTERTISREEALADFDAAWEIVYETHFDETFNGVDWLALREELRPEAAEARTRRELRLVMQDMLSRLGQSHFAIIPDAAADDEHSHIDGDSPGGAASAGPEEGEGGDADTGLDLRVIGGRPVVWSVREGGPGEQAGVRTGWVLTRIGSIDVEARLDALGKTLSEEEVEFHAVSLLTRMLQGPEGSTVELAFLDADDREVELAVEREPMPGEFVKFGNLPPLSTHLEWSRASVTDERGNPVEVGIIRFNIWMIPIAPKFERAMYELRDVDGLIIDLRGNLGGVGALSSSIGRFLVSEEASLGTMMMRGTELSFNIEPVVVTTWGERIDPFTGPIAILQDGISASTSEVFAGGLQSLGRVKVFGTRSAGMALPAGMDKLPSGDVLLHAIADFVTTTGARMEHGGVVPDEPVETTRRDLLEGRDPPKDAAKSWIAEQTDQ